MVRKINAILKDKLTLSEDVEEISERKITSYGNGAKIDSLKKHIGKRCYVIIVKD